VNVVKKSFLILTLSVLTVILSSCAPVLEPPADPQRVMELKERSEELYLYSRIMFEKGDMVSLEQMEASLNLATSLVGEQPRFVDAKGCLEWRRGNRLKAEQLFLRSLKMNPYFSDAWEHLAFVMIDRGNEKKASEFLKRAIELKPDNYRAKNNMALELAKRGSYQKSYDLLLQANLLAEGGEKIIISNIELLDGLR